MPTISLTGSYIDAYFNATGDLISPTPKDDYPASKGIYARTPDQEQHGLDPDTKFEWISWRPFPAESWVLAFYSSATASSVRCRNGSVVLSRGSTGSVSSRTITCVTEICNESLLDNPSAASKIELTHTYYWAIDDTKIKCDVYIKNISGSTITDVKYLRTINPKQGIPPFSIRKTDNRLNSPYFPEGIAVDSIVDGPSSPNFHLGLASSQIGTRVNATGNAQSNQDVDFLQTQGYYELISVSPTVITSGISGSLSDCFEDGEVGLNLWFNTNVIGDIAAGATKHITFYYVLNGIGNSLNLDTFLYLADTVATSGTDLGNFYSFLSLYKIPDIIPTDSPSGNPRDYGGFGDVYKRFVQADFILNHRYQGIGESSKFHLINKSSSIDSSIISLQSNFLKYYINNKIIQQFSVINNNIRKIQKYKFQMDWRKV